MTLYLAVTADKYELPICVETTIDNIARRMGVTRNTVAVGISRGRSGSRYGFAFRKVTVEEE